jgi:hypothetical protein
VHGHGGILLEQLNYQHFHLDAHPGDWIFWFTTTGWMLLNYLVGRLLTDAAVVLFDGDPSRPLSTPLCDLADATRATWLGTSASFIASCQMAEGPARQRSGPHCAPSGRIHGFVALLRRIRLDIRPARGANLAVLNQPVRSSNWRPRPSARAVHRGAKSSGGPD